MANNFNNTRKFLGQPEIRSATPEEMIEPTIEKQEEIEVASQFPGDINDIVAASNKSKDIAMGSMGRLGNSPEKMSNAAESLLRSFQAKSRAGINPKKALQMARKEHAVNDDASKNMILEILEKMVKGKK